MLRLPFLIVTASALAGCGQPQPCDPKPGWRPDMQQCDATESPMKNQHALARLARIQRAETVQPTLARIVQSSAVTVTPQQRLNRYYAALQGLRTPDHAARVRVGALLKRAWSNHA